jgi:carboxyl-terminal processing protease
MDATDLDDAPTAPRRPRRGGALKLFTVAAAFSSGVCFATIAFTVLDYLLVHRQPAPIDGRLVEEVTDLIAENYVDAVDAQDLLVEALRSVAALDPYSDYIAPAELPEFREETEGEYVGIGVLVKLAPAAQDELEIDGVLPGGPAERAGLRAGDVIVRAEDIAASAERRADAPLRERLEGPAGSKVRIWVRAGDDPQAPERRVEVVRQDIAVPSVAIAAIADAEHRTGYIRLTQFQTRTATEFREALAALRRAGMRGLVLDLRDNPGGIFKAGLDVVTELLAAGTPIVRTKGRVEGDVSEAEVEDAGSEGQTYSARRSGSARDLPLVVLANSGSASAAEILVGAVQDHRRGVIVGAATFGKGRMQTIFNLRQDAEQYGLLKLTTQEFFTPLGRAIDCRQAEPGEGDGPPAGPDGAAAAPAKPPKAAGLQPDVPVEIDSHQGFRQALAKHFEELRYRSWREGRSAGGPPAYHPFEWRDPVSGEPFRDQQLVEALACLADRARYARIIAAPIPASAHARSESDAHAASRY